MTQKASSKELVSINFVGRIYASRVVNQNSLNQIHGQLAGQNSLVRSAEFFLNYCLFLSHNLAQKKAILSGNIEEGLKRYISDPPETPQECSREMLERLFSYVKKVLVYNLQFLNEKVMFKRCYIAVIIFERQTIYFVSQ